MGNYEVETRNYEPKNFIAGGFPTVADSGAAGADIAEFTPVTKDFTGKIVPVAAAVEKEEPEETIPETISEVIGISVTSAKNGDPVAYYMTGEFFADAINLPDGVEMEPLKDALRKISIYLK